MVFADLKNDYIFRRIFGTHPDILRGLLNDLLERTGDRRTRVRHPVRIQSSSRWQPTATIAAPRAGMARDGCG
jgi:hypothetical protein